MIFEERETYGYKNGIYMIQNTTTECVYIGQTKQYFLKRFYLHDWLLRHCNHFNANMQLDWNMFGEESFKFSVLEIACANYEYDEREKHFITFYKSIGPIYNVQDGGKCTNLAEYITPDGRKRVGELNRIRITGSKLSDSTKQKMSQSRKGKTINRATNKIDAQTAKRIKELLINGYPTGYICEILEVPYKVVNGILSLDNWSSVFVDGWDNFQKCRIRRKGKPVGGRYKK